MSDANPTPADTPQAPAAPARAERHGLFWRKRRVPQQPPPPRRGLLSRLFGIRPWGALRLVLMCIAVGFLMLAVQFDPRDPDFNAGSAVVDLWNNTWAALGWAVQNLWKPALAGASVVLPIWILWRLATLPFRR